MLKDNDGSQVYITQGFICRNAYGEIDNLQRGGSDYTASLVGAALNAEEIQIWTDIDGMHNNDPRVVDKTSPVHQLHFEEAAELAYFGAKILHPHVRSAGKICRCSGKAPQHHGARGRRNNHKQQDRTRQDKGSGSKRQHHSHKDKKQQDAVGNGIPAQGL